MLRLAGCETDLPVKLGNVTVNRAELRADSVLLIGEDDDPRRWAACIEVQVQPDRSKMYSWQSKQAGIAMQTGRMTVLLVLYLMKGRYQTFPDGYDIVKGPYLTTSYHFGTIKLWEHVKELWSGIMPGLAALLLLCYLDPGPEVLEREREIILESNLSEDNKSELLAAAVALGGLQFPAEMLRQIFEKEAEMIKEKGILKEWIDEGIAKGRAEGEAKGKAEGEAKGEARGARELLLAMLSARFGSVPESVAEKVRSADVEWCLASVPRIEAANHIEELAW
jgi:hypothetical protein